MRRRRPASDRGGGLCRAGTVGRAPPDEPSAGICHLAGTPLRTGRLSSVRIVSEQTAEAYFAALTALEPRVVASGNFATPWTLLSVFDRACPRYRIFVLNPQRGWPCRTGVITETPFVGPGVRSDESLDYLPMRLSLVPRLFELMRPPDVVLVHTSVPRGGKVSLGMEVNILPAAIEHVRDHGGTVVAQMNPRMPYTFGDGELECDMVDLALEVDQELPSPVAQPVDETTMSIADRVAAFVTDGCTLQAGIGQIPDTTVSQLRGRQALGIWSEMISDGVVELHRAGALDEARPIRSSFIFGSPDLYRWAHENPVLEMVRTETINDPARIAANPAMLSLNSALQVDLFDQANATYLHGSVYSGFGGQPDFVVGALHSRGGHAVIALRSWLEKHDCSTIVPVLTEPVTSLQHSAIVTEQGCAEIFGRSRQAQARMIIENTADPRAKDALLEVHRSMGLSRDH